MFFVKPRSKCKVRFWCETNVLHEPVSYYQNQCTTVFHGFWCFALRKARGYFNGFAEKNQQDWYGDPAFSFGIYAECRVYALAQGRDYEFTWERFLYGVIAKNLDETGAYWYLYAYFGFLYLCFLLCRKWRNR